MSFSKLFYTINDNQELSQTEKIIYSVILDLDNEKHCLASNRYLSERCSVCENTITSTIARLENMGFIKVAYKKNNHRTISCEKQNGNFIMMLDDVIADENLTSTDKIVFSFILNYDKIGKCYASNEHLAKVCCVSTKTIKRSIGNLIANGYITVEVINGKRTISVTDKCGEVPDKNEEAIYNNNINSNYSEKISCKDTNYSDTNNSVGTKFNKNSKGNYIYNNYINIYNSYLSQPVTPENYEIPLLKSAFSAIHNIGGIGKRIKGKRLDVKIFMRLIGFIRIFAIMYYKNKGEVHPGFNADYITTIIYNIFEPNFVYTDISFDDLIVMIDRYFNTKFNKCDYRFAMFMSPGVFLCKAKEMERITGHKYNISVNIKHKQPDTNKWWYRDNEKENNIHTDVPQETLDFFSI